MCRGQGISNQTVSLADAADVFLSFVIRRDVISILHNSTLAGVVPSQSEIHIPAKQIQQKSHVASATLDVLFRIPNVRYAKANSGWRHQLHKAARAFVRHCARFETRFLVHDRVKQQRIYGVALSGIDDEAVDLRVSRRESTH